MKQYFKQRDSRLLGKTAKSRNLHTANMLAELAQFPVDFHESMVFRGSLVRRLAQVFEGKVSKLAEGFDRVLGFSNLLLRLGGLYFFLVFCAQSGPNWFVPLLHERWAVSLLHWPQLDVQVWSLLFLVLFYMERNFVRLRRFCRETKTQGNGGG